MTYPGLEGRTLGVIGLGHIGQRVVELAKAFHMRTLAVTRTPLPTDANIGKFVDIALTTEEIDTLYRQADFVVPCVPQTKQTENLLDARAIGLMKPSAHFVNIARGGIANEEALYQALVDRRIAGAALDVWWNEPLNPESSPVPSRFPFHELDNVLMSPHASAVTESMIEGRLKFLVEQMGRLVHGQPLVNVVHVGS
jgi:phosphoglycerate dehydrogenase-like enzyme